MTLTEERDLVAKLETHTGKGSYSRPLSATYDAATNETLLGLARDGLRYRLIKQEALQSAEPDHPLKSETFVGEIDRRLAAL